MAEVQNPGLTTLRRCLFLVSLPLFFVTFSLPVQSKALGASALEIGGLFSLFSFSILLMRPIIGFGIDRFGRRVFFLFALLFYIGAYLGYALADGIEAMYVARLFQGLGAALLLITVDTMTADLVPHEGRARAMGGNVEIQTRSSVIGATIGFTLIGVVPASAWTYSFSLFAGLAVIAFFLALARLPETRAVEKRHGSVRFVISPGLKKLLLLFVFLGLCNALILPVYMIYIQDNFTADPIMLSWAFLPSAFIFMFLPSRMGAFADRHNPRALLAAGMVFAGCCYFAMTITSSFLWIVLLYSTSVVGWALIEPIRKSLTASSADPDSYARSFGLAEMAFGGGATLGPLIGGYLYDNVSQTSPFIFNGVLIFASALLMTWLLRNWTPNERAKGSPVSG